MRVNAAVKPDVRGHVLDANGEPGPGIAMKTEGLGFTWPESGPRDADTPEEAINALCMSDVANTAVQLNSSAPRMPGACLVIGPLANDGIGGSYCLTWSRHIPGTTRKHPTAVSLVVVAVVGGIDPEEWRSRMLREAKRAEPGWGSVHYQTTKNVTDFRALPHVLEEAFAADGIGWAQLCDYWLEHVESGVTFQPVGRG